MIFLALIAAISCKEPEITNVSGFPWNAEDDKVLIQAKKRCGELYPDAPCVKLFRKWGERDYSVICSGVKNDI